MPSIETPQAELTKKEGRTTRAERLRQRIAETTDEQSLAGLERIFEAKLAAVGVYEQQLTSVTDPFARKTLQRMIRQERQELLNLAELTDLVEASPDMGDIARTRRRLSHRLKMSTGQDAKFWLGALVVGTLLLPSVREKFRPLAVKTAQGIMELSEQVQGLFSGVKEDIEDLVSEAQFEKLRQSIDDAIAEEVPPPAGPEEKPH